MRSQRPSTPSDVQSWAPLSVAVKVTGAALARGTTGGGAVASAVERQRCHLPRRLGKCWSRSCLPCSGRTRVGTPAPTNTVRKEWTTSQSMQPQSEQRRFGRAAKIHRLRQGG